MEKTTAKIIGFNNKIAMKFRNVAEWTKDPLFTGACQKAAEALDIKVDTLITKRQASKFLRGQGLVYKHTIGMDNNKGE